MAVRPGLKLSEYGLFQAPGGKRVPSHSEEEVDARLGLPGPRPPCEKTEARSKPACAANCQRW